MSDKAKPDTNLKFTDEDVKNVKKAIAIQAERLEDGDCVFITPNLMKGLFARLEAAEKCSQLMQRFVERQEHPKDCCRCDFCFAVQGWLKSKSVKP